MARIVGTYSQYVQRQRVLGRVTDLSHKTSEEIEIKISNAFIKAKEKAEIKQRKSSRLLRHLEALKGY